MYIYITYIYTYLGALQHNIYIYIYLYMYLVRCTSLLRRSQSSLPADPGAPQCPATPASKVPKSQHTHTHTHALSLYLSLSLFSAHHPPNPEVISDI